MEFIEYYLVLLKKGPTWAPGESPVLEALQERHLAHLESMFETGKLIVAGPVQAHSDHQVRGVSIFRRDAFDSLEQLKELVEQDPAIQAGRLRADYYTWYYPRGTMLG